MVSPVASTSRTRINREPQRAVYDRETAYQILDEGFICHVGFSVDGQPYEITTSYGRAGGNLYLHGSVASRILSTRKQEDPVCAKVALLYELGLEPSDSMHSM